MAGKRQATRTAMGSTGARQQTKSYPVNMKATAAGGQ
ncbi:uncharacterized protein METZ01_LOCUS44781 [marine metagenome]|uniref:Uncharacterized protein n=1 Tax=marine metagenome TaxID=408172 RepID=A0A381RPV7_9ZZZZ